MSDDDRAEHLPAADSKVFAKPQEGRGWTGDGDPPLWLWQLNGAGDPAAYWIDHAFAGRRAEREIDAGFASGTWALHLTLPTDLADVEDDMHPAWIAWGLSNARLRLEQKLEETVAECRRQGLSWDDIGRYLGVTRQSAWREYGAVDA